MHSLYIIQLLKATVSVILGILREVNVDSTSQLEISGLVVSTKSSKDYGYLNYYLIVSFQ